MITQLPVNSFTSRLTGTIPFFPVLGADADISPSELDVLGVLPSPQPIAKTQSKHSQPVRAKTEFISNCPVGKTRSSPSIPSRLIGGGFRNSEDNRRKESCTVQVG